MSNAMPRIPDQGEQYSLEQAASLRDTGLGIASGATHQTPAMQGEQDQVDLLDFITDPNIDSEDPHQSEGIEEVLNAELSRASMLGNIGRDDWREETKMNRIRATVVKGEFRRGRGAGSKCTGDLRGMLADETSEKPVLTPQRERQIDTTFERTIPMRDSLSVGARLLRAVTEIITEQRSQDPKLKQETGGILSRVRGALTGGR